MSMRRLRRMKGPALVAIWFLGPPVTMTQDTTGRYRLSVGAGAGQYELVSRSCDGEFLSSDPVGYRTSGAQFDARLGDQWRVTAFGGTMSVDDGGVRGVETADAYGGFVLAMERPRWGIGLGPVLLPGQELPSVYLRAGDLSHFYGRADFLAPSPVLGTTGLLRTGFGFDTDRVSGLVGVGVNRAFYYLPGGEDLENGGPFAELFFRVSPAFDATFAGSWHIAEEHSDWGAAGGLRYRFGR